MRDEAATRRDLIDPALTQAGWSADLIEREYMYKQGRVRLIGDEVFRERPQYIDYVLCLVANAAPVAIVEAKAESKAIGAGLTQAIEYAMDLGVRFAYSTNGHGFVEQDLRTGALRQITQLPTPGELAGLLNGTADAVSIPQATGGDVRNPLHVSGRPRPRGWRRRYYQEAAVRAAIDAYMRGQRRALLTLATGTGKTSIAADLAWKLKATGCVSRVLFLVDRVSLLSQAYNAFSEFGDGRGVVENSSVPWERDIHFATYQSLFNPTSGDRLYRQYPAGYFDAVIVDECHRSGYGDWRVILEHLDPRFTLGMTATPKRTDTIDTYRYFAAENIDEFGQPSPIYEYSLAQGISDGFLATYQVHRVSSNLDHDGLKIVEELARGAELIVPDDAQVRDTYITSQFEREIVIPDRTRTLCEHLASKLRSWGLRQKTIIFCVTMEHADLVRQEMQRLLGPEVGSPGYAVRIVSEERESERILAQFSRNDSLEPVIATTVDLLSTGVDIPSATNIVFMRNIASPTLFKQIVGRGTRLNEETGKLFFRIVDYTNATRLLDAWDIPPQDDNEATEETRVSVPGTVLDGESNEAIANASVKAFAGSRLAGSVRSGDSGSFVMNDIPLGRAVIQATATNYTRTRVDVMVMPDMETLELRMVRTSERDRQVQINGVTVTISDEDSIVINEGVDGVGREEYLERIRSGVLALSPTVSELADVWRRKDARTDMLQQLRAGGMEVLLLPLLMERPDADLFDLVAAVAYDEVVLSRGDRAGPAKAKVMVRHRSAPEALVDALLDRYRLSGPDDIATADVFWTEPFQTAWGGLRGVVDVLGGATQVRDLLVDLQGSLY
jgi:type I restriction enzyme, R subunit